MTNLKAIQFNKASKSEESKQELKKEIDYKALEEALDEIYHSTKKQIGESDYRHIKSIIKKQRSLEVAGRTLLHFSLIPGAWLAGTTCLSISKILENMEIGHNVMHGQYDWTQDPELNSKKYEWDIACDSDSWRNYHNYEHHTYTNILGKDRDVGYEYIRISQEMDWRWYHTFQVTNYALLALFFQWGVALHDAKFEKVVTGEDTLASKIPFLKRFTKKASYQLFKDYVFFPTLALPAAPAVFLGNMTANTVRNVWTNAVIFCGHFPDGAEIFHEKDCKNETKGQWYYRQLLGSCNIEGKPWLHTMTGHLSYQIEHHLFPDIPAIRYREMGPKVEKVCKKLGIPYNSNSFVKQYSSVLKKIVRYTLP